MGQGYYQINSLQKFAAMEGVMIGIYGLFFYWHSVDLEAQECILYHHITYEYVIFGISRDVTV